MINTLVQMYKDIYQKDKFVFLRAVKCYYCVPKFRVATLIRYRCTVKSRIIRLLIEKKLKVKYCVEIGADSVIEKGFWTEHYYGIVIGNNAKVGANCTFYQNVTIGQSRGKYPRIGSNVIIYPNSIVLGDIAIGNNSIILAGSVVLSDVPENTMVGGNPATVRKQLIKIEK